VRGVRRAGQLCRSAAARPAAAARQAGRICLWGCRRARSASRGQGQSVCPSASRLTRRLYA
jgi:hypothetical protein